MDKNDWVAYKCWVVVNLDTGKREGGTYVWYRDALEVLWYCERMYPDSRFDVKEAVVTNLGKIEVL